MVLVEFYLNNELTVSGKFTMEELKSFFSEDVLEDLILESIYNDKIGQLSVKKNGVEVKIYTGV